MMRRHDEAVRLRARGAEAIVDADGATIVSLRVDLADGPPAEVLARCPWSRDASGARMADTSAEWHRRYAGGWDLLLPRALGPAVVAGVEQPFHGEAAWRRWSLRRTTRSACTASVLLRTVPLGVTRTTTLVRAGRHIRLSVSTSVHNYGTTPTSIGWAEHPALSGELFDGGSIEMQEAVIAVVAASSTAFQDRETTSGRATIRGTRAVATLLWDAEFFPRAYVWQERGGQVGFPWFGRGDAVAVEPAAQPHDLTPEELGPMTIAAAQTLATTVHLSVGIPGSSP